MKINSTYLYLLLSAISLLLAFAFAFFSAIFGGNIADKRAKQIQTEISTAFKDLENAHQRFLRTFQKQGFVGIQGIDFDKNYPSFIFQNKKLLLWSDYRFIPEFENLQGDYKFKILKSKGSYFLVCQSKQTLRNDDFSIFSLQVLYQKYNIENTYLQSDFNREIFSNTDFELFDSPTEGKHTIYAPNQTKLLSFSLQKNKYQNFNRILGIAFLVFASFIFLGLFVLHIVRQLEKNGQFELGFLVWLLFFALLRFTIWFSGLPLALIPTPKEYSNYVFYVSPITIELVLYAILLGFLGSYILKCYAKSHTYQWLISLNKDWKLGFSVIFILLGYANTQIYFETLHHLFLYSSLHVIISKNIGIDWQSMLGIVFFLIFSMVYFLGQHVLVRLYMQLNKQINILTFAGLVFGAMLYIAANYFLGFAQNMLILCYGIFFFGLQYLHLPRFLYRFNYNSSLYLFAFALWCGVLGTYALYFFGTKQDLLEKREFANLLLPENDEMGEGLIAKAIPAIQKDKLVQSIFNNPAIPRKPIRQKIKKLYLGSYFDKYEVQIHFFDAPQGNLISPKTEENLETNYFNFVENYQRTAFDTANENIWFVDRPEANVVKRYLGFIEIKSEENIIGYIILDLKQKKGINNNVYPELLVDKTHIPSSTVKNYSYAIYDDSLLVYSVGKYNYERDFDLALFKKDALLIDGLRYNGSEHLAVLGGFGKRILVSAEDYSFYDIFSNFSFLFLVLVIGIVNLILVYSAWNRWRGVKINFATRIQIYLNIAFFLPLFVVSITTLSIISSIYKDDFEQNFISKTETIASNILPQLENYLKFKMTKEDFSKHIQILAQNTANDLNVFDANGVLLTSSQPAIYESNEILSKYINPQAIKLLRIEKNKAALVKESAGKLEYQTVYIPLKIYTSDKVQALGFVSIPFFDAQATLNQKLLTVLATIINIFASIFIVFVVLSYFASQILTVPLRLITQQIRKTTFSNYHEPLEWNSDDEIGLFVSEYNKMLRKLDRSKDEIARSHRETAWREIAQQVAHEIKNPLTPMKLTIQHMQMRLQNQGEKVRSLFERSFDTLISQIDILSDIATSFSSFAKMPIPISERFELTTILKDTQNLYVNENIDLDVEIEKGQFYIRGDRKLMGRIFTNLIKNAIEAVPEDRKPEIHIKLSNPIDGLVMIEVQDNGLGIPEEVQEKIFMPNFSTKSTGSGIGLAIAKRGIEHAGGRIWFETEEEIGTSFFMELPLIE